MGSFLNEVGQLILTHYNWRYPIIALALLIHGEAAVIIAVYLILKSYLNWGGFILAAVFSFIGYETFFYFLGRFLKESRLALWFERKIPPKTRQHIERHLHEKAVLFLIASKFVIYLNVATLFLSGWIKMDFKKFFTHRVIANSVWFLGTTLTAYLILSGAKLVSFENRNLEFGAIIFILFIIFGSKHILKKLIAKEGEIEVVAEKLGEKTNKIIKAPTDKQSGLET